MKQIALLLVGCDSRDGDEDEETETLLSTICPEVKVDMRSPLRSDSAERDENLAELLWASCMLEMTSLKEVYKDLDFGMLGISGTKLPRVLPRQIQLELLECIKEKVMTSHFSRDDERWYLKLIGSLVSRHYRPAHLRRYLARVSEEPSSSPSAVHETLAHSKSKAESKMKDHIHVQVIVIAVVATSIITFILTLLFFFCCNKCLGISFGNDYKNGNALLGAHTSDSSDATDALGASTDYSNAGPNVPSLPLKLPSQRIVPLPVSPPLEPLLEREQALPTETPAKLRVSLSRIGSLPPLPSVPNALSSLTTPPPPPPPKQPPSGGAAPPPPPPPSPPITAGKKPGVSPPPPRKAGVCSGMKGETKPSRTKLKPFFWDKVLACPGHSMVWDQIKSGSFQYNEEMIESLFMYVAPDKSKLEHQKLSSSHDPPHLIQILDAKKAHNVSILMRALNFTTREVCDAIEEGNELPPELLEVLLKMAPTTDEELKLRLFNGELSQLCPPEWFLKVLVDIPFAYKRMEALLFMCTVKEEVRTIRESFLTLKAACNELRNSRLFLKLLEAVLKTGNRMNDGTFRGGADAFKLDTLLKLSDVKAIDGKLTLLLFVVAEIIRSEGIRAARGANEHHNEEIDESSEEQMRALGLHVVSGLSAQMENVKKAAGLDVDSLSGSVSKLGSSMAKIRNFLDKEMKSIDENNGFHQVLKCFVEELGDVVTSLVDEEKRIGELIKSTADYFHGKPGKEEGLRLFSIVRDFLIMLDKACRQVEENSIKKFSCGNLRALIEVREAVEMTAGVASSIMQSEMIVWSPFRAVKVTL
ncbi:hypothetical protein V2J09_014060 [Rumex salicifolius]